MPKLVLVCCFLLSNAAAFHVIKTCNRQFFVSFGYSRDDTGKDRLQRFSLSSRLKYSNSKAEILSSSSSTANIAKPHILHNNNNNKNSQLSRVTSISSKNLGGVVNPKGEPIVIEFPQSGGSFLACTGETGSGKSLLIAKAAELLLGGGRTKTTFLRTLGLNVANNGTQISAQIEFHLQEPHLTLVRDILNLHGHGDNIFLLNNDQQRLQCSRRVLLLRPKHPSEKKYKLRSICHVNGLPVTLQLLSSIVAPLLAIVDGTKAAAALASPRERLAILDAAVPTEILVDVTEKKEKYWQIRKEREKVEASLKSPALPRGFALNNKNEDDCRLLAHWVKELDAFETRVGQFCKSLGGLVEGQEPTGVVATCHQLSKANWMDNDSLDPRFFASTIHSLLLDLREGLSSLDNQIIAANMAVDALSLLSSKDSVLTALERSRNLVNRAARGSNNHATISDAAEQVHNLLNEIEEATKRCARQLEDDRTGLLQALEAERQLCPIDIDQIDEILLDWGTLARKHSVSPASLPSCHEALLIEQSGKDEAFQLLPQLEARENFLLKDLVEASSKLSQHRHEAAVHLSASVNERLPSLGMKPTFEARVDSAKLSQINKLVSVGADDVDFFISQGSGAKVFEHVHLVASSGEKARILLAIECAIPGSVASACTKSSVDDKDSYDDISRRPGPVLVLYDEIDAHISGYAATALGMMLSEQANSMQVLAITHSPAVAALADHHIMVKKLDPTDPGRHTLVDVKLLESKDRAQELARMASGNLANEEAEAFANALLRKGASMRNTTELKGSL